MEISSKTFYLILGALLLVQGFLGLWRIGEPFVDGRYHYNWGPVFWLEHAKATNDTGIAANYFGVHGYSSHPQLIGPVAALWTRVFGYSEYSIRTLPLLLTMLATAILALAMRIFLDARRALAFAAIFAALPLIYIYGKKLDQEQLVLVFAALHLYALAKLTQGQTHGRLALVALSGLGLALSDWSGLIISFALSVTGFFVWRENRRLAVLAAVHSLGGALVGLWLFFIQSYLQAGSPGLGTFIEQYAGLWKYRASTGTSVSGWLSNQFEYLTRNYSIPLALISIAGVWWALRRRGKIEDPSQAHAAIFVSAIGLANLAYMLAVPQASAVHLYYQYFLSIPIAFGILMLLEWALRPRSDDTFYRWLAGAGVAVFLIGSYAAYQYTKLLDREMAGDETDIALIASLKELPQDATVIGAHINETAATWFEGSNIRWYSGRTLEGFVLGEGLPFAEYIIVPKNYTPQIKEQIEKGSFGSPLTVDELRCSNSLCLLNLKP